MVMKLDQQTFTLADTQTSGGLLVAVASEGVSEFEQILKAQDLSDDYLTSFGWLETKKRENVITVT
jgi:selenide,water dikinase